MGVPGTVNGMESASDILMRVLAPGMGPAEESPEDYRDEEGILRCGVCGQPKEMHLDIFGGDRIVRVNCECAEERCRLEAEEAKRTARRIAADDALHGMAEIEAAEIPEAAFGMADDPDDKYVAAMRRYAERFGDMLRDNVGVCLYGGMGTGKTFLAQCVATELIRQGRLALFTSIRRLASASSAHSGDNAAYVMKLVKACDLLILDDFGAERNTEFMNEQAFEFINARCRVRRPMLVTTNLAPGDALNDENQVLVRAFERITESCRLIRVDGQNRHLTAIGRVQSAWDRIMNDQIVKD